MRGFVIFLIFIGSYVVGNCQIRSRPHILHFNSRDYQADFQNWSVAVSPDNTVYVGNNQGLLVYKGPNWSLYQMPEGLVVRSVSAENDSVVFVGAYEEFGYWKEDLFGELKYFSLSDSLHPDFFHNDEIWRIITHNGKLYFQSFSSIFIYDGKSIEIMKPDFTIVLLQKAKDRLFIHGVGLGLYELIDNRLQLIEESKFLADDEIKLVLPYGKEAFIIGAAETGLYLYQGNKIIPWEIEIAEEIRNAGINNGVNTKEGIIIGTIANGIYILDRKGALLYHMNTENQLQNNTVLSLNTDAGNNFWAALYGGMEFVRLDNEISFYVDYNGELGSVFSASVKGRDLWIGSNRGLYRFDIDPFSEFNTKEFITGSQGPVWTLQIIDGELWCGHNEGTYQIRNREMHLISDHNGGYTFKRISRDTIQYMIQSTYSPLVVYTNINGQWRYTHTIEGFAEPVNFFEFDFQGNIWANHATKGIFMIKLNEAVDSVRSYRYIGIGQGLPAERNLFVAKLENRIVFTTGKSIYTYDDLADTIVSYTQLNQQLEEYQNAKRIIPIRENHYWFILPDKIGWFSFENQIATLLYEYNLHQFGVYLSSTYPKITVLDDSTQFLCLDNGFAILHEGKITRTSKKPAAKLILIHARQHNGEIHHLPIRPTSPQPKVQYTYRNIQIRFSTDQRILFPEFSYYLEGLEKTWSSWMGNTLAEYTRLPYGNYVFKLKTRNEKGLESNILSYPLEILPPWYASNIAVAIYVIIIMVFGTLLRIIFLKRLKRQSAKLAEREKQKREQERLAAEKKYMRLKNEKLQSEIQHQNVQLANRAMALIQKDNMMLQLKEEIEQLRNSGEGEILGHHYKELIGQINKHINSEEEWKEFEYHFDQTNQHFFKRLKKAFPELTPNDLRLCAYLRMNLSSKEIAPLLSISLRGVEIKRYRLRKRLNLDTEENLIDFLLTF